MRLTKQILKWLSAAAFVFAGALHFIVPDVYLKIMPPVFPAPLFLVYLSGIFEIVFGALLVVPKYARLAAYGLIALLVAVFPANVYMWTNRELFPEFGSAALALRLPLQLVLIGFVYWIGRDKR